MTQEAATLDAAASGGRDAAKPLLAWWQLVVYGLPGVPLAVLLLPLYVTLPTYYATDLGVGFAAVGAVLLVVRFWDVVTDPLIGLLSDRTPGRFGRRKPWLVAGTPLLLLSAWMVFQPPEGVDWLHLLIWTALMYLGGTMILLPYSAWAAEISPDYHERSRIAASREVAVIAGTVLALLIPALLVVDRPTVMAGTAWALTVLLPLAVLAAVLLLPDKTQPILGKVGAVRLNPRAALRLLFDNRPFRKLIAAYFINGIAYGLPATLFLLYVEHVLRAEHLAWPLLAVYFASAVAGVPVWLRLSRRFGKHRVWMAAMGMAAASFWTALLLGEGDVGWFLLICILTGFPLGAELVLPPSMQADVIDLDSLKSGRRRAGVFFATWGVATKVPLALGVGIAFPILALAGFEQEAAAQEPQALLVLAAMYSLLPVVIKLIAIWILRDYPIDAAEQQRIRAEIARQTGER